MFFKTKNLPLAPLLFLLAILISSLGCKSQKQLGNLEQSASGRFAFYNVENLFDVFDDPNKNDEEFTPEGNKKWTKPRYQQKINQLSEVIVGMDFPDLLGVCEVENKLVLTDWAANPVLKPYKYQVVHYESPDKRGIDNGFLYKKNKFKVLNSEAIQINFPADIVKDYKTRDILYIQGIYQGSDTLHVFINHWPSRRGGLKASQPKRVYVASQLRKKTDAIFSQNPNANILLMGDFNDETDNISIATTLGAGPANPKNKQYLYNLTQPLDLAGKGTYKYKENWNMLDQIIVSKNLLTGKLAVQDAQIYQPDYLNYVDKKYGKRPNKTYGGKNYYGGYSDHYPVFVDVKRRN